MSTNLLDNFIFAENMCTGSQGDQLSNCILENLKFMPYLEDQFDSNVKDTGFVKPQQLPYIFGQTYTTLRPLAIANVKARMQQENDYGVVSFRCLQAFSRPMLTLPRLQDLGIAPKELNITETIISDELSTAAVPLKNIADCLGDTWCIINSYAFNCRNLVLAYSTSISTAISASNAIKNLINGTGDFYLLPALAVSLQDSLAAAQTKEQAMATEFNSFISYLGTLSGEWEYSYFMSIVSNSASLANGAFDIGAMQASMSTNVTGPLIASINSSTDFTTYDYNITSGIAEYIAEVNYDANQKDIYASQQLLSMFGTPASYKPTDPNAKQLLLRRVAVAYVYEIFNLATYSLTKIQALYSFSNVSQTLSVIQQYNDYLSVYSSFRAIYTSSISSQFVDIAVEGIPTSFASKFQATVAALDSFLTSFNTGSVLSSMQALVDSLGTDTEPEDTQGAAQAIVDSYLDAGGTGYKIQANNLKTLVEDALNLTTSSASTIVNNPNISPVTYSSSGQVMTLNLGYSFKDKQKFYFADVAYSVGFGRLRDLHSIQINNELYFAEDIVDDVGNPISGISESGCTKYTFNRHVLPTYEPTVEMYIYPGVPDQPYSPTVNKYHNYNICKYSGMFTKLLPPDQQNGEGSLIGLYVFTGYRVMEGTVENLYQLGTININAINLNDPSLDENSYEAMLQRQVVNMTNSSSLVRDGKITTDDLKYYFMSSIIPGMEPEAMNLPNMAIVEFKSFPLGNSLKAPEIVVKFTADDPYIKA